MSERETLLALAERCEKASGPDREIDCRIYATLQGLDFDVAEHVVPSLSDWRASFYTASLDAAMSLVPEGERIEWSLDFGPNNKVSAWVMGAPRVYGAATPALALCSAALKARAQSPAQEGRGE